MTEFIRYKKIIDEDINCYIKFLLNQHTSDSDGSRLCVEGFTRILRHGKRIRGSLVTLGYELCGGEADDVILQASRAIEMIHAHFLIVDDIQDNSDLRRGELALHKWFENYHKSKKLNGDPKQFGISMALNSAGMGNSASQSILANLDTKKEYRTKVVSITNRTSSLAFHGQANEFYDKSIRDVELDNIVETIRLKTSNYSFLNPLHVGMVLAGADCHDTDAITEYALNTGIAFQILNDYQGIFNDSEFGDLAEGKITVFVYFALKNSPSDEQEFLLNILGNPEAKLGEKKKCADIIRRHGLNDSIDFARNNIKRAYKSLDKPPASWNKVAIKVLFNLSNNIEQKLKIV